MPTTDEFAYRDATELAALIRARQLSPVELVEAAIARIEARNPSITAFVFTDFERARQEARKAENAVMSGEELGPLHGLPTALKDLFNNETGWPDTFGGIRAMRDHRPDYRSSFAQRIQDAGAILLGKTNSPTMGFRGVTDNFLFGPSRNPFDVTRNTGGSSGGSAGAVADGLIGFAQGTDGGGSIRIPASFSGVYGYKASSGRVPFVARPNAFSGVDPYLYDGPIVRTVADAALVLTALAGYDPRDPFSLTDVVDYQGALRRSIKGMRIAWTPDFSIFPVEPAVLEVTKAAVKVFGDAGAEIEEVSFDFKHGQSELSDLWCRMISPLSCFAFERLKADGIDVLGRHADDLPPELRHWVDRGFTQTMVEHHHDQAMRTRVFDEFQRVFADFDLIVSPTLACLPAVNSDDGNTKGPTSINGEAIDPLIGWCITYLVNYTGHPACSIPAGLAPGNLPVGLQIIGRRHADADVLAASAAFERRRPWRDTYEVPRNRAI